MQQTLTPTQNTYTWPALITYLTLFTTAELLTNTTALTPGLLLHALLLLALLTHGVLSKEPNSSLYISLSIIPLIRLLSLSTPFWLTNQTGFFALVNLPLIIATLVAARTLGTTRAQLGLKLTHPQLQILIALSGIGVGTIERLIIQPDPLTTTLNTTNLLWPILSLMLFTGLSEELLFRGILQTTATKALGNWPGLLLIATLFGIMHIGWNSLADVIYVTIVGIYFGWIVLETKSIIGVTIAHGLANIMLFIVLPLWI